MMRWLFLLLASLTVLLTGCQVSPLAFELEEEAALRQVILDSLDIPFKDVDMVVYQVDIDLCGNTTDAELAKIYVPVFGEAPYLKKLQSKGRSIIILDPHLKDSIMGLRPSLPDSIHPYTHYLQNKIKMQISGTIESNQRLILHERYDYGDKRYAIDKLCEFKNGKWELNTLKISVN